MQPQPIAGTDCILVGAAFVQTIRDCLGQGMIVMMAPEIQ